MSWLRLLGERASRPFMRIGAPTGKMPVGPGSPSPTPGACRSRTTMASPPLRLRRLSWMRCEIGRHTAKRARREALLSAISQALRHTAPYFHAHKSPDAPILCFRFRRFHLASPGFLRMALIAALSGARHGKLMFRLPCAKVRTNLRYDTRTTGITGLSAIASSIRKNV